LERRTNEGLPDSSFRLAKIWCVPAPLAGARFFFAAGIYGSENFRWVSEKNENDTVMFADFSQRKQRAVKAIPESPRCPTTSVQLSVHLRTTNECFASKGIIIKISQTKLK
jgi:hypothetical protein